MSDTGSPVDGVGTRVPANLAETAERHGPWGPAPEFTRLTEAARQELAALWEECEALATRLGLQCRSCGECCDFRRRSHVLFAAKMELDVCLDWARRNAAVSAAEAGRALAEGLCPFWEAGAPRKCPAGQAPPDGGARAARCLVWPVRPMGCRLYFCEGVGAHALAEASTQLHRRLSQASARAGVRWWYGPALEYVRANFGCAMSSDGLTES